MENSSTKKNTSKTCPPPTGTNDHTISAVKPSATLQGANRVKTRCLFVSGISPDCTADHVGKYILSGKISASYWLLSAIYGQACAQSAKLFASAEHADLMRDPDSDFWKDHNIITCRLRERDSPRRAFEPSDADVSGGNKNAQV